MKKIFNLAVVLFLIVGLVVVSAGSDNTKETERFFSKIKSFITGFVVWPGQPSKPFTPAEDIGEGDEKDPPQELSGNCLAGDWNDLEEYRCVNGVRERKQNRTTNPLDCNNSVKWVSSPCESGKICSGNGECILENIPVCENFLYSEWGVCNSSGQKTRIVTFESPESCRGGVPDLVRDCICTEEDWKQINIYPPECPFNEIQRVLWGKIGNCTEGIEKPSQENVTCNYEKQCTDECQLGNQSCFGSNSYKICKNDSQTGCTYWGNKMDCPTSDYICVVDKCVLDEELFKSNDILNSTIKNNPYENIIGKGGDGGTNVSWTNTLIEPGSITLKNGDAVVARFFSKSGTIGGTWIENNLLISSGNKNGRNFILVKNTNDHYNLKTIFLTIKYSSTGVCIKDEEVGSVLDILSGCVSVDCPGIKGNYNCSVESIQGDKKVVSVYGLIHSGVIEVLAQTNRGSPSPSTHSNSGGTTPSSTTPSGGGETTTGPSSDESQDVLSEDLNSKEDSSSFFTNVGEKVKNIFNKENNTGNSEGESKNDLFFYVTLGVICLAILLTTIIVINKRKKKRVEEFYSPFSNTSSGLGNKFSINQTDSNTGVSNQILDLIKEGDSFISKRDYQSASKIYNRVNEIYNLKASGNVHLHKEIIDFYNRIMKLR